MSNKREYLLFEDVQKNPSLQPYFDACVNAVLDGTACITKTRYFSERMRNPYFYNAAEKGRFDADCIFEVGLTASEFTDTGEFEKYDPQNEGWEVL